MADYPDKKGKRRRCFGLDTASGDFTIFGSASAAALENVVPHTLDQCFVFLLDRAAKGCFRSQSAFGPEERCRRGSIKIYGDARGSFMEFMETFQVERKRYAEAGIPGPFWVLERRRDGLVDRFGCWNGAEMAWWRALPFWGSPPAGSGSGHSPVNPWRFNRPAGLSRRVRFGRTKRGRGVFGVPPRSKTCRRRERGYAAISLGASKLFAHADVLRHVRF
jgi:hypothetical protein